MQANQKSVIWTVIIATVLLLVIGGFAVSSVNSNLRLVDEKLDGFDVDEQAIANAIVAGIVMPTMPEIPEFPDTGKLNELWDAAYGPVVKELEDDAFIESVNQFFEDNNWDMTFYDVDVINDFIDNLEDEEEKQQIYEDDEVYDLVTDGVECDGDCVVEFIREYEDDREIEVINLGLDDKDDRKVELSSVIKVKVFTDEDDDDEYFFDKVYIDSTVTSDDGKLEAEVAYSL